MDRSRLTKPRRLSRNKAGKTPTVTSTAVEEQLRTNSWLRIGLAAKDLELRFNSLLCHYKVATFSEAFRALDASKAVGIDGKTKDDYAEDLESNLKDLEIRIHKGTYRPLHRRRAFIPKHNGKLRPIAISSIEDKLVEWVTAKILRIIN